MARATRSDGTRGTHLRVGVARPTPSAYELGALAERLRALRLARGLTQWELAERGLSYKYYQRIEAGRANATIRTLARIARALGVPLHELFRSAAGTAGAERRRAPKRR